MSAPHPHSSVCVGHVIPIALLLALVLTPATTLAKRPTNPGRWTGPIVMGPASADSSEHIAVHLALLRGDMSTHRRYHSQIFWYGFGDDHTGYFRGGYWTWNPTSDSCATTATQNLIAKSFSAPPKNIFCSGHTHLPDGNLFLVGGHDGNNVGITSGLIFNRETHGWALSDSMSQRRWYGSAITMPTGKVLALSGYEFTHIITYGGRENSSGVLRNKLNRFEMVPEGRWGTPIDSTGSNWPTRRENHALANADDLIQVMFGGRQSNDSLLQDTWLLARDDSDQAETYAWAEPNYSSADRPLKRMLHVSAARGYSNDRNHPTLYVYGGRNSASQTLSDLWQLTYAPVAGDWTWAQVPTKGIGPSGGLHGHTGVLISNDNALLFFGGKNGQGALSDTVWALTLADSTWRRPLVGVIGSAPAPRYLHAMTKDPEPHTFSTGGNQWTRSFVFGGERSDSLSSELYALWSKPGLDSVMWQRIIPNAASGSPSTPAKRKQAVIAYNKEDRLLGIFGGETNVTPDTTMWIADFRATPRWERDASTNFSVVGSVGFWESRPVTARVPELYDPAGGATKWSALSGAPKLLTLYPYTFTDTLGRAFVAGPPFNDYKTWRLDPVAASWTQVPSDTTRFDGGCAISYRPGQVMKCGSKFIFYPDTAATGLTKVIDLQAGSPAWTSGINSMIGRVDHNLNVLPTGEVLVNGGTKKISLSSLVASVPVNRPEIWDPDTISSGKVGYWFGNVGSDTLASSTIPRDHHSTSVLLPDSRIFCAGGIANTYYRHTADMYCPPHLFTAAGIGATRPRLLGVQEEVAYNQNFIVSSPDSIVRAVLIKPGAVTHTFNMGQRWVPLARVSGNSPCVTFKAPADSNIAPPGDYMLFVLSPSGVPSIAEWVRVGHSQTGYSSCDTAQPATVTNLGLSCLIYNQATIEWTAPEQNGGQSGSGAATLYDMRQRDGGTLSSVDEFLDEGSPISLGNPQSPGSTENVTIGLTPGHTYHVRIMSRDYAGSYRNWSNLSNDLVFEAPTDPYEVCEGDGLMGGGGGGGGSSMRIARTSASAEHGAGGIFENTLLRGAPIGAAAVDALGLAGVVNGETYRVRLRESGSHRARVDRVRLLLSDHPNGSEAHWSRGRLLVGAPGTPGQIKLGNTDVSASLAPGNGPLSVTAGQTMEITLDSEGGQAERALLVDWRGLEGALPESTGAQVESKGQDGTWHRLGWISPRKEFACSAIDSIAGNELRLRFKTNAQVQAIRTLALDPSGSQTEWLSALDASNERGDDVTARVSEADTAGVDLSSTDTLSVAFQVPALPDSMQRDAFLVVDGTRLARTLVNPTQQQAEAGLPTAFALRQNEPNPFTGKTAIHFDVPRPSPVRIEIFDVQGRRIATLANRIFPAGRHVVEWDRHGNGARHNAGVFFYRMQAGAYTERRTMVLLP